ncbi:hypothetical protein Lmor_1575 [Legionella moravica]|uniref:DUF4124 domain-containing protein n=1 Tax=Legionella moravica TaxID=39962 RepID=A0A378JWY8_9GAMM|nr:DUF4124 domain-containing protein [Legionella moravica]KTD34178.1 hypothetical protein Lmor_1575 [Legionella moravica]STX62946.1 Uncharacterised protein [Legionella moravica]
MKKLLLAVSCMVLICASYAQIYKWTDSQGVVHFSDRPHPGSEQLKIPDTQSYTPPVKPSGGDTQNQDKNDTTTSEEHKYTKIGIIQPLNEATIRNNQGYVVVAVELEPTLAQGDSVQIIFDGAPMGEPQQNLLFQLNGIYRGKHTLAVQVINSEGEVLLTSDTITIFMHRPRVGMVQGMKKTHFNRLAQQSN